jgi:hypothetical protein
MMKAGQRILNGAEKRGQRRGRKALYFKKVREMTLAAADL